MVKKVIIENQSVLDAATQFSGTLEAAFDFCLLNSKSLTDELFSKEIVLVGESIFEKKEVSEYFDKKETELATGFPLLEPELIGIGVMIIEQNFIVS